MRQVLYKTTKKNAHALTYDAIIIAIGIAITILLSRVGVIDALVYIFKDNLIFASFIAGIFFTSTFTIAPSSVAIVHIAENTPLLGVALWGALGAMFGDLILFFFIRDRFSKDLMNVLKPSAIKHFLRSFHFGFMKWLSPLLGAIIIASPLPDEFGITLLGMSKVKVSLLIPISFIMNALGIYLLVQFANFIS
ncbi:MAG TPA: hypothetical protein VJJ28_01895 [Candidatus Paceibacterota bacterium]